MAEVTEEMVEAARISSPPQQADLRKAVIEECAQLVEDGYKCRNCGTFGVMAALENCCERLSIDSPNNAELAAGIRALATRSASAGREGE